MGCMKEDLPPWSEAAKAVQPGIYEHFKGGRYRVLGVAHGSEHLEELVVYQHLDEAQNLWVRPVVMWSEAVDRDGYQGPRFRYISTE